MELLKKLEGLLASTDNTISNLANASALLWLELADINWAGFYLRHGEELLLGPFQGKPACTRISLGKGVCGTAAAQDRILRVDDVHTFAGHIACDSASASEIVLPLHKDGRVVAVLDIDSPLPSRFTQADEQLLADFARILETNVL